MSEEDKRWCSAETLDKIFNKVVKQDEMKNIGLKMMSDASKPGFIKKRTGATMTAHAPALKPTLVRGDPPPQCYYITNYKTASKKMLKNVVSWPVPNEQGEHVLNLCFYVREVQSFIERKSTSNGCPMFGPRRIRRIFRKHNLDYEIKDDMDIDFVSVFVDYDATTTEKRTLKRDAMLDIVKDNMVNFVKQQAASAVEPAETKESGGLAKMVGFFWYATKKAISAIATQTVSLAIWMLANPFYLRMTFMLLRIYRIVICVSTSFPDMAPMILEGMVQHLQKKAFGYGQIILRLAKRILECFRASYNLHAAVLTLSLDKTQLGHDFLSCFYIGREFSLDTLAYFLPEKVKNLFHYGTSVLTVTVKHLVGFIGRSTNTILESCGISFFSSITRVMSAAEAEKSGILGFDKFATTAENIRIAFATWDVDLLDTNVVLLILDILVIVIDVSNFSKNAVGNFVKIILKFIPCIGPYLLKKIGPALDGATQLSNFYGIPMNMLRYVLCLIRRFWDLLQFRSHILNAIAEIKDWIFDLFPCLFKFTTDKLISLMTFGQVQNHLVQPADTFVSELKPPCCLAPIIQLLQRQVVFGELDRQNGLARQELRKKRSEVSWWDYLSSGPAIELVQKEETDNFKKRMTLAATQSWQGGREETYTTESLGESFHDLGRLFSHIHEPLKIPMTGSAPDLQFESQYALMCVPHGTIQTTRVFGNHLDKVDVPMSSRMSLHLYLCHNEHDNYQWNVCKEDVLRDFPPDVVLNVGGLTMLLIDHMSPQSKLSLAQMQVPLYRV